MPSQVVFTSVAESSRPERLAKRRAIEQHFAKLGHTYRHGKLHRVFERHVTRPLLKGSLQILGAYEQGRRNALELVVRQVPMYFAGLPREFDGFQILHLSDFHIDGTDGLAEALAESLRELRPDLCVFTGDYRFDDRGSCEAVYPRMRTVVESIHAREGVIGILGNHDPADAVAELDAMGVRMLVNDAAKIRRGGASIWIIGLDDNFDYQTHDLDGALASVPEEGFKVLLAHAPELFREAARNGIDLYLAGHTHGGQIRVPLLGALKHNAKCPPAYAYGQWRHGRVQGYTSGGVGCSSLPIRFNCPPELVMLELRRTSTGRHN
jgi:hypothetical protein